MRSPVLLLVAILLLLSVALAVFLSREDGPPEPPSAAPPPDLETLPRPASPEPRSAAPGNGASPEGPPHSPPAEPGAWAEIERALIREPDPAVARTRKALETSSVSVDLDGTPLIEVARLLGEQSGIDVLVLPTLFEERSQKELLVTLPPGPATVTELLDAITSVLHIAWWIDGDGVRIAASRPRPKCERISIPLGALSRPDGGYELNAIGDMIRERIDRDVWEEEGEFEIDHDGNALMVTAPTSTQRKILALLRELLAKKR